MKLTDRAVKGVVAPPTSKIIFDADLKGFGVLCRPPTRQRRSGSKTWIAEYRPGAGGRRVAKKRKLLGAVNQVSARDARQAAIAVFDAVRRGEDPVATKIEARQAPVIRELVFGPDAQNPGYHDVYESRSASADTPAKRGKWKASTSRLYASYWRIWILPEIGQLKLRQLTRADVGRLHRKIAMSSPITANRCVTLLRAFWSWCEREQLVSEALSNPTKGVDKSKECARERYLTPDELERLIDSLDSQKWLRLEVSPGSV